MIFTKKYVFNDIINRQSINYRRNFLQSYCNMATYTLKYSIGSPERFTTRFLGSVKF